ncbi:hypothetical protein FB451DRAFT_985365, partial [Mycena latifolia]
SVRAIPQITAFERAAALLTGILRWTNARAHIIIYRWCSSAGPEVIKQLFDLHREKGFPGFGANTALGYLVDHIVQFIEQARVKNSEKEKERRSKARKKSTRAANSPSVTSTAVPVHGEYGPTRQDLTHIPGDLYGVLDSDKKRGPIALPYPGGDRSLNLYAACQICLLEVFHRAVIMPSL